MAGLTFKLYVSDRGVDRTLPPARRRFVREYQVVVMPASDETTHDVAQGDLVLQVHWGPAAKKLERRPKIIAGPDCDPKGEPKEAQHDAELKPRTVGSARSIWIVEVEFPLPLGSKAASTFVSAQLLHKGKAQLNHPPASSLRVLPLNTAQTDVVLTRDNLEFPVLSETLCTIPRAALTTDWASHSYRGAVDTAGLKALVDELAARLDEGLAPVWTAADEMLTEETYGHYTLKQREAWAFGGAGNIPPTLPARGDLQVEVANELWARAITELVTFSPYYGPGPGYFDGDARTTETFDDGEVDVIVSSTLEYDMAEGISGSPRRGTDAFYPIVGACQHLATLGVLSRGWYSSASTQARGTATIREQERSLNAGSTAAVTYTNYLLPRPGSWMAGGGPAAFRPEARASGDALVDSLGADGAKQSPSGAVLTKMRGPDGTAFGPASVGLFANRGMAGYTTVPIDPTKPDGPKAAVSADAERKWDAYQQWVREHPGDTLPDTPENSAHYRRSAPQQWAFYPNHLADNTEGAHIGLILRSHESTGRYQVLDTGGLNAGTGGSTSVAHSGERDYRGTAGVMSGADPYRGVGLAPTLTEGDASGLRSHVNDVLRAARPLGLMRLLFARRGPTPRADNLQEWLLYASPLMRLYGNGHRASLADLVWSLRDFPMRNDVQVIWSVRLPVGPLARAMMDSARANSPVEELVRAVQAEFLIAANTSTRPVPRQRVNLYVEANDIAGAPLPHDAQIHRSRAHVWCQQEGFGPLAAARVLSKFTRVAVDMTVNAQGQVESIAALNAHSKSTYGYWGSLPHWHLAESVPNTWSSWPQGELALPLNVDGVVIDGSPNGGWLPTVPGYAAWVAQRAALAPAIAALRDRFG